MKTVKKKHSRSAQSNSSSENFEKIPRKTDIKEFLLVKFKSLST